MRSNGSKAIFTADSGRIKGLATLTGLEVEVLYPSPNVGYTVVQFEDGSEAAVRDHELSDVFTESSHTMSALVETMKARSNGTHYYSDVSYELLYALDPEWTEASGITRESFRY